MEKKRKALELRERLDKVLALPDLVGEESIKSLVKDQLLCSSFNKNEGDLGSLISRRTKEVSDFLDMLRSASRNERDAFETQSPSHNDWKIKQDTDQLRVLYREGLHGSPFHTLLAEGFADGPLDVCLCASWESTLYHKWWPQYNFPTFKITTSTCLQRVRDGEQISLIRMKVPWPVSAREAIVHYFEVEYLKEGLIIILLNTIPDMEHIDMRTHGFNRDAIPEAKDTVRVDLVGGFVLQRVSANRSYFRMIANMDIKLDIIPPSLINFVSRQLIGNGHKLYQKAVGSVVTTDKDYLEALKGPMYVRIREGLDSINKDKMTTVKLEGEHTVETALDNQSDRRTTLVTEIVEEELEDGPQLEKKEKSDGGSADETTDQQQYIITEGSFISDKVKQALDIIDQAIAIVRGAGLLVQSDGQSVDQDLPTLGTSKTANSISDKDVENRNTNNLQNEAVGCCHAEDLRYNGVGSNLVEARLDTLSLEQLPAASSTTLEAHLGLSSAGKPVGAASIAPVLLHDVDSVTVCDEQSLEVNGFHGSDTHSDKNKRKKKHRFCCLTLGV